MAGWTDNLDGTWTITPTITVPDSVKEQIEQVRKGFNFLYFTTATEMDDQEFVEFFFKGRVSDRGDRDIDGTRLYAPFTLKRMWLEFKKMWTTRKVRIVDSADDGDTEALAVVVPAPQHRRR